MPSGRELEFLHPLPIRAIWGIGPATAERLSRFGVRTVADLALLELVTLRSALGPAQATALYELARGIDDRPVEADRPLKSVGHEETYAADLFHHDDLRTEALRMSDAVAGRLRAHGSRARTVTIKVRWGRDDSDPAAAPVITPQRGSAVQGRQFATITRARTLRTPTDATRGDRRDRPGPPRRARPRRPDRAARRAPVRRVGLLAQPSSRSIGPLTGDAPALHEVAVRCQARPRLPSSTCLRR